MNTTSQTLKAGTRIELHGTPAFAGFPGVAPEQAIIGRWSKVNGPHKNRVRADGELGWHVVKFADGGGLLVHETRFRIIDNR